MTEGLGHRGLIAAEGSGEEPDTGVGDHHGSKVAGGKHVVADRELTINKGLADASVDAFVVAADEDQMLFSGQGPGVGLAELVTGRAHQEDLGGGSSQGFDSREERFTEHHLAGAAAVGTVVDPAVFILDKIAQLVDADFTEALAAGTTHDGGVERGKGFGEQGDDVNAQQGLFLHFDVGFAVGAAGRAADEGTDGTDVLTFATDHLADVRFIADDLEGEALGAGHSADLDRGRSIDKATHDVFDKGAEVAIHVAAGTGVKAAGALAAAKEFFEEIEETHRG
ncbi:MAG: hypothetical protein RLZZ522_409 [Verrucomicrobiota bacterium]